MTRARVIVATWFLLGGVLLADEPSVTLPQEATVDWSLTIGPAPGRQLDSQRAPILDWGTHGRAGKLFLWMDNGRPVVIGGLYVELDANAEYRRKYAAVAITEFTTLTDERIRARRKTKAFWKPVGRELKWTTIPRAAEPAGEPAARIAQARREASRFDVNLVRDGRRDSIVMLPQTLHEYHLDGRKSGAIFAFGIETDPFAILMVESRPDEHGKLAWLAGFAPLSPWRIEARLSKSLVWSVPQQENFDPQFAYTSGPRANYFRSNQRVIKTYAVDEVNAR